MLIMSGTLLSAVLDEQRDKESGEIRRTNYIQLQREFKPGKWKVEQLRGDPDSELIAQWAKLRGQFISVPVAMWEQNGRAGLTLADKKALPTVTSRA